MYNTFLILISLVKHTFVCLYVYLDKQKVNILSIIRVALHKNIKDTH